MCFAPRCVVTERTKCMPSLSCICPPRRKARQQVVSKQCRRHTQELENMTLELFERILNRSMLRHNASATLLSPDLVNVRSIFLKLETADLGGRDLGEKLSKLPVEDHVWECCFHFSKQVAVQMQLRLPNASSALRKLNAINPETAPRAAHTYWDFHLTFLGGCPPHELESEIRNLQSLSSTLNHTTCLNFWHGAAAYTRPFASPRRRVLRRSCHFPFRTRIRSACSLKFR